MVLNHHLGENKKQEQLKKTTTSNQTKNTLLHSLWGEWVKEKRYIMIVYVAEIQV